MCEEVGVMCREERGWCHPHRQMSTRMFGVKVLPV